MIKNQLDILNKILKKIRIYVKTKVTKMKALDKLVDIIK